VSPRLIGVLLAGGQARRMGGGDKCLQLLGRKPLLSHVIARLAPQVDALVLSANGDISRFAEWNLPIVTDDMAGHPGPLAGILAGVAWAAARGASHIVSVPTDTPFLPTDLVARLAQEKAEIAVAASGDYTHFATALWPVNLQTAMAQALKDGVRRMEDFLRGRDVAVVHYDTAAGDPFFNINTPEDLEEATRML
jgi:molybdopterin-guanine dinucleotide biosynthesis protein A